MRGCMYMCDGEDACMYVYAGPIITLRLTLEQTNSVFGWTQARAHKELLCFLDCS